MSEDKCFEWNGYKFYTAVNSRTPKNKIIVSLSNGETVFEDDTYGETHFWRRMQEFIHQTDVKITKLRYQVGRYMLDVPDHAKCYFFVKRQYGELMSGVPLKKSVKIGASEDGEIVHGSEYGEDGTILFTDTVENCGLGIIRND